MLFKRNIIDINAGIEEYKNTENAILVDVREEDEYKESYIVESINLPLSILDSAENVLKDKSQPVFVYCRSGNRSGKAEIRLKEMGYANVKNIGGIMYCDSKYIKEEK